jgi:adenylate cyclase
MFNWIVVSLFIAASGIAYNLLFSRGSPPYVAAIFALFCGLPLLAVERGIVAPRLYRRMHALPTLTFLLAALVVDFALISAGFAVAGTLLKSLGILAGSWAEVALLPADVFIYAVAMSAIAVFVMRVRELLGRDIFLSLLTSRYRKPINEERVFLFIDLAGSTAYAEEFGDLRAQQFLGSLFTAFAEPVRRNKGAIDDYVGDAAIVTWPFQRGITDARCIRCIFDIIDGIEADAETWRKTYGHVPRLRAALHGGFIITAEIGVDHHKITYFGDTVNTTARLEALCRTLDRSVLISADLAGRMTLPEGIVVEDLGQHAVKGRDQTLGVIALHSAKAEKRQPIVMPVQLKTREA